MKGTCVFAIIQSTIQYNPFTTKNRNDKHIIIIRTML